eukprot:1190145-Prorocentrum_minimum.AAC.5
MRGSTRGRVRHSGGTVARSPLRRRRRNQRRRGSIQQRSEQTRKAERQRARVRRQRHVTGARDGLVGIATLRRFPSITAFLRWWKLSTRNRFCGRGAHRTGGHGAALAELAHGKLLGRAGGGVLGGLFGLGGARLLGGLGLGLGLRLHGLDDVGAGVDGRVRRHGGARLEGHRRRQLHHVRHHLRTSPPSPSCPTSPAVVLWSTVECRGVTVEYLYMKYCGVQWSTVEQLWSNCTAEYSNSNSEASMRDGHRKEAWRTSPRLREQREEAPRGARQEVCRDASLHAGSNTSARNRRPKRSAAARHEATRDGGRRGV